MTPQAQAILDTIATLKVQLAEAEREPDMATVRAVWRALVNSDYWRDSYLEELIESYDKKYIK